jgi:hypothetical protein
MVAIEGREGRGSEDYSREFLFPVPYWIGNRGVGRKRNPGVGRGEKKRGGYF